jgi:hypothetical protein
MLAVELTDTFKDWVVEVMTVRSYPSPPDSCVVAVRPVDGSIVRFRLEGGVTEVVSVTSIDTSCWATAD